MAKLDRKKQGPLDDWEEERRKARKQANPGI